MLISSAPLEQTICPLCLLKHMPSMSCRKWDSQLDSILQMCKTVFILIVLGGGALLFSADANRLVLIPVDRMVQRVKSMADNPRCFQKVPVSSWYLNILEGPV
jgi:hypothetical protein